MIGTVDKVDSYNELEDNAYYMICEDVNTFFKL